MGSKSKGVDRRLDSRQSRSETYNVARTGRGTVVKSGLGSTLGHEFLALR
jgi:hypothetical protein